MKYCVLKYYYSDVFLKLNRKKKIEIEKINIKKSYTRYNNNKCFDS